jgi:tetratricopeptide (TPR) repeat protein
VFRFIKTIAMVICSVSFVGCAPGTFSRLDSTIPPFGPIVVGMSRGAAERTLGDPMMTFWMDDYYYTSIYEYTQATSVSNSMATDFLYFITFGMGVYIISPIDTFEGTKHLLTLTYAVEDRYRANDSVISVDESQSLNEIFSRHWAETSYVGVEKGAWEKGIESASNAIAFNPQSTTAYINRAWAYCAKGFYDKAIADCNTALGLDPGSAPAYNNRGLAYQKKGHMQKAMNDYKKACELGLAKACENLQKLSETKSPESPSL